MNNITKLSFYWRNMPILHNFAAEGFDTICMCLQEAEVYWTTQVMLQFYNFDFKCVIFWNLANYFHVFVLFFYSLIYYNQSHPSVHASVCLSIWTSVSWLIAWDANSSIYLAYTVHIWHSNWLLCVDDNKVSDYCYDLDFKGQGQIYSTFIYS